MPDDLGARLLRAGLVTRDQLGATLASAPPHGGALVAALVARGVPEEALAGFFLAEGFGPLMEAEDLASATPTAQRRLPAEMAADLLALPVRASPAGLVVAMAAPADRHAVREIARVVGSDVLPTVACVGALRAAIRAAYPGQLVQSATPAPAAPREDSEPPVLELVRRRSAVPGELPAAVPAAAGEGSGQITLGPRLVADDDEPALPLVRTKPQMTPPRGVERAPAPEPAPVTAKVVSKAFARPEGVRRVQVPLARDRRGTAEYPAVKDGSGEIAAAIRAAAAAATEARAEPAPAPAPSPAPGPSPAAAPSPAPGPSPVTEPSARASSSVPAAAQGTRPTSTRPTSTRPTSIVPPEHERWDLGTSGAASSSRPASPARPAGPSVRPRSELPPAKAPLPEVGAMLAGIRGASDRDVVVRLACEGAVTVARTAVFLALRKGVLKGWEGAGGGLSRDALRNLWIPTTSPSTFKTVVDRQEAYVGPYGSAVADGLFRAAVGSRGGDLALQPIVVGEKLVGLLCADDLLPIPMARQRIEVLAHAVSEAFKRIIVEKKS